MKALGDGAPVPKAFPLHSQYVANMKASREAAAEGEGGDQAVDSSGDEGSEKPRKSKKKPTKEARKATTPSGSPWNYNSIRLFFIHAARKERVEFQSGQRTLGSQPRKERFFGSHLAC